MTPKRNFVKAPSQRHWYRNLKTFYASNGNQMTLLTMGTLQIE
jgi:hypothetical protein